MGLPAAGVIILEVTGFHLSTIFVTMMHNEVVRSGSSNIKTFIFDFKFIVFFFLQFLAAHIAVFSVLFAAFFVPLGVSVCCCF